MVEKSRHVGYVRVVHVAGRLPRIDPLKNSGNRLSFTSSGSRSRWFPRMSGKASTLRRFLHTARRPEIVRRCSRALLRWMLSVAAVVRAFHVVATCANPRPASLTRPEVSVHSCTSPPLCCWSASTSCFGNHARAHSGIEHTSAVSTVTVCDPRDQPSSSPRATSWRSPCITGYSCSSSSPGNHLPLFTRSGSRSVQSSFGNPSSPRRNLCLPLSRRQRLTPPCS